MSRKELTIIKTDKNEYKLVVYEGWGFLESLKEFCKKVGVKSGYVASSLGGGIKNIKAYHSKLKPEIKTFTGPSELLNAQVNFTTKDGAIYAHGHLTLSHDDDRLTAFGGHFANKEEDDAIIGITTQMYIKTSNVEIKCSDDPNGLPIIITSKGTGRFNNEEKIAIASFVTIVIWLSVITFFVVKMLKKSK